jgi:regulator of sirC expression with transglutaminase-like and TPR domain
MVPEVRRLFLLAFLLSACLPEKPDPAAQAAAIINKHPSDFLDQLSALDAMAAREIGAPAGPTLIESVYRSAARLSPLIQNRSDSEKVAALNAWVFDTLGVAPLLADSTLASSLPSLALAGRQGSCVGLTLLYLALGKALDLPLKPVFLPGHVFVRYRSPTYVRNIETLRRGIARSDSFYDSAFALSKRPWYTLQDAEPRQALGALVFNLGNTHRARGDWKTALEEFHLAERAVPGLPEALGSEGAALLALGDRAGAKEKLLASLAGDSLSEPARINLAAIEKSL